VLEIIINGMGYTKTILKEGPGVRKIQDSNRLPSKLARVR